ILSLITPITYSFSQEREQEYGQKQSQKQKSKTKFLDPKKIEFDIMGDLKWSKYNFTDVQRPYEGTDNWTEFKISYPILTKEKLYFYYQLTYSATSENKFEWQKYIQDGAGIEWFPFDKGKSELLKNLRFFTQISHRNFDKEVNSPSQDIIIGTDFYYDNLLNQKDKITNILWSSATYHTTNFALNDYDGFIWAGNVKVGRKFNADPVLILPYVTTDWTYSPSYGGRWWENYVRIGAGIKFYPLFYSSLKEQPKDNLSSFVRDFKQRLNLYVEVLENIVWFDEQPQDVEETDYRVGITYSTHF
ncbi:hypothetical protein KKC59_03395, partial [bacterium]|nr:hypothetical protein [bacterium]